MNRSFTLKIIFICFFVGYISINKVKSQNPSCGPLTPFFEVNLVGSPAGTWLSPNVSRRDDCCGSSGNKCISFDLTLDPKAAGIQIDMIGADPAGALFYSINCIGSYPGGTVKCISGSGVQRITFCKPGNNKNIYKITSIAKPIFPPNDTIRIGCSKQLISYGIIGNTTNWKSIYPGAQGAYNSYLSCTNCASPFYTPPAGAPAYVDYQVCGFPQASLCGYNAMVCDTVRIYNLSGLSAMVTPGNASFCTLGPGSGVTLTASASGGLAPYSYTWRNSSNIVVGTGASYFATQAGNYMLELRDQLNSTTCLSYYKTVPVTAGGAPVVNAGSDRTVCRTNPTLTLEGTVQNASGGTWTGGNGVFNPGRNFLNTEYIPTNPEISSGSITLTLTSTGAGENCTNSSDQITIFIDKIRVTIPPASLSCNNTTTTLFANVSNGTPPYIFQWNNGGRDSSINVGQGNFTVTVTGANGCSDFKNYNLTAPQLLATTITSTGVTVNGANDGTATATASGGTLPYTFLWSNGGTTATINNLSYGIYTVTITDSKGCLISGSTVVNEPRCLGFNVSASSKNVTCNSKNNGIAFATASGGTSPYSYSWNDVQLQTNDTAFNLYAGAYTITVEDANNCFQTKNTSITQPPALYNTMNKTNVVIVGDNTGSATANPFGGNSPYAYSWNNGGLTQTIDNLTAGMYVVTITDNNGCSIIDSVLISEGACNNLSINASTTNVSCFGGNSGSAFANVINASPPFTINWSNGQTGTLATGLSAGNYSVSITDAKNCYQFDAFSISQPSILSSNVSQNNVSCFGSNDGTIDLTITGGKFPYTFNWSHGSSNEDQINLLAPGTYSVVVTDKNGCSSNSSAIITQPSLISGSYSVTNVTCFDGSNGAIDLTVSGGTFPFKYRWSSGSTTQDLMGIQAGGYYDTITDANNCKLVMNPTPVTQPSSVLAASLISQTNVFCYGDNNGSVTVAATGGSGSYSYSWNTTPVQTTATATNLTEGSYTVTVTDNNGCTIPVTSVATITQPSSVLGAGITSQTNVFCNGDTAGDALVTATGGSESYSYSWNTTPVQTTATAINLSAGSYTVTVTDNNGCTIPVTKVATITQPASVLGASITSQTNVFCNGGNTGTASVTAIGGSGAYSYSWNTTPVQTTATAGNLTAGSYTVTITDNNGCTVPVTIVATITQPSSVLGTSITSQSNVFCNGGSTGTATVTASGGSGGYSYSWNTTPIQTTATAGNLTAGSYTVTVTDNNGCTVPVTSVATITQPVSVLGASITSQTNVFCNGDNTGTATVTATGGSGGYSYSWNTTPEQTTASAINLSAGSYTVTVTDNNGCTVPVTSVATITQPVSVLGANVTSQTNVFCNGGSTGSATVAGSGGSGAYSYSWNTIPVQTTATAGNLTAGSYTVTVTDNNGCTVPVTIVATITQPSSILGAIITSQTNVFCNGGSTGTATVTASGGSGAYSYSWNTTPVQTTATAGNLTAGSYTVTVTDNNGCTIPVTSVATITQPSAVLDASITSQTNVFCNGGSTGTATVTASGGSGAYSYSWNTTPVQTTATASNLIAGSYTVTVTDNNGCTVPVTSVATITQPSAVLGASITSQTNVFCNGGSTGSATIAGSGGSGSYSYSWNTTPVQTTSTASNLTAGSYTVTVTDNNGCTVPVTSVATITQPSAVLGASITSQTNVFCNGSSTGSATVTGSGGSGFYSYSWNTTPVQTTATAINLTAGNYTVTVTDNNGCTVPVTKVATITQPVSVLAANITSQTNVFCNGGNTGVATVMASGGSGAYSYSWNTTPAQTTATAINLSAGSYTVTVTDNNGCTVPVTNVATITQPVSVLGANVTSQTNVFCNGGSTGTATVTATGGSGAYFYSWNTTPVQTTATATNLTAGSYTVTVTDNNGCTVPVTSMATITQPSSVLGASITSQTNVFCNGGSTGSATVAGSGGSGAYSYSWNTTPVQTTSTASNLIAGSYTVTVTDNNGCTVPVTSVATITQPSAVLGGSITSQTNVFCNGGSTGSATVAGSGGSGAYSYSWNTIPVQTTATAGNLTAGSYTVTVTDNNGCTVPVTSVATITQPSSVLGTSITSQTNVFCNGGSTGTATVTASGGSGGYSYSWNTTPIQTTATAGNLTAGSYTVTVTDNNGCTVPVTSVATITQPVSVLGANITSQTNVFCNGDNTGTATVTATGGSGGYSYSWNTTPEQPTASAINLSAGSYTVTVMDNNGCTVPVTSVATITQPVSVLGANVTSQTNVFCNGGSTGSATVTGSGGSGFYSYSWNTTPIQTTATAINLTAGNYTVTVTDNNGCTVPVTKVATITQPVSVLVANITSQTNVFCNGGNTGVATVMASGGSGAYSYSWNTTPAQTTATAINLSAGSFTVTVTDNNGCTVPVTSLAIITQPVSVLGANVTSQTNVFCNGGSTGTATVTATGGSGAYFYSWNTTPVQTTATATNLTAGSYTVTVTDNNGCTVPVTSMATITQPSSVLGASITSQTNVFCNGGSTGSATVAGSGGSGAYSYSWNTIPVQTTASAINLSAGSYTVTVTDNNGCTVPVTSVATITQPVSVLGANVTSQTNVFCNGGSTGSATVAGSGGSGAYSYSWNTTPVQTTSTASNLTAGSYTVTVTDNNGCTVPVTSVATITQPSAVLGGSITSQTNVFCNGGSTGSATVAGSGGSGAYSYSWNTIPVQTTATAGNLTAGSYTVTVTDNNGCTVPVTSVATITQPVSVIGANVTSQTNVFCNGGSTGTATVTATGGSGAYFYSWNTTPVQTTATATNLTAGSYTVTVTDNNGCTVPVTSMATITQPSSVLGASITSQTNVFCNGGSTGSATVAGSGGSGAYSYSWNTIPVQTTATAINLTTGSYTVTVTDNNGCTVSVSAVATITEPVSVLSASINQQTNVFCNGGFTGGATVNAIGGSGSYSYLWNSAPLQIGATAINLSAGSYTVTVTDNNGCTIPVTSVTTITQPVSVLSASISQLTDVFCNGCNTGSVTVTATGGSGSYSYSWNTNPVQTTATANNLAAGSYTVTVTDNNGCTIPVTVVATISEPGSVLGAFISSQTNVFCFGDNTGEATVTAIGGSGSYSYSWNTIPVQTTATATNLTAGSYTVTVMDNNGSTITVTAITTITQPLSALTANISSQTNVFCRSGNTGNATVTASGGSGSYSYLWNTTPLQIGATAVNLSAGSYTVTVTDNNGCAVPVSAVATITQPGSVLGASINQQTNVFCNGGNTGEATVTATGGSGSYSYSWNTSPVQTTATANNLIAGSYTVTVTDNNGCTVPVRAVATITQPVSVLAASINQQTNVFCNGGNTGSATVLATGGSGSYSYSWNTSPAQTAATAVGLAMGTYTVTITDNNGCAVPVTKTVIITQPTSVLGGGISSQTNVFCNGGNTGSATVTATGGSGSYSYSWNTSPTQTTATAIGLTMGTYTVSVTDNNGCTVPVTKTVTITQPTAVLGAGISSQTNVFCNGGNTGSATVTATGGSGSYSYSWNTVPAQTTATASGLTSGSFNVIVTDNNGCTVPVMKVAIITQPSSILGASISSQTDVFCNGGNTGNATVTAIGGSGSYSYSWNTTPVQASATATGLVSGSYTVTVTDINGCTVPVTKVVTITQPSSVLGATISSQTNVFCNGGRTGSATVTPTGGSGSYSYSWNTTPVQTTATANNLTAGSYSVTVTDNNGCTVPVIKIAIITQPILILGASISSQTNVFCNGGSTGSATVTATGGSGSYSYLWNTSPAQIGSTAVNLSSGSYTVTVTDNNGCTVPVSKVVTITQPSSAFVATISSQINVFCNGGSTGAATVTATGGSGSYSYSWNTTPVQITATANNLNAGSYSVTVTDNNGCTIPVIKTAIITQPILILGASISSQTNVFCNGGSTGSATVTATGGSGSYSYSWNTTPSQTTATASGLPVGSYTVTVTDINGCTILVTKIATITQPSSVLGASISSQTNVFCNGGNTGSSTVTATGGSGSYSYSWNTIPVQTTATASSLQAGSYTVTVTDNNGCAIPVTKVVTITQPALVLTANISSQTNVFCNGGSTGNAAVTASGGSGSYSYLWNTTPLQIGATAINLSAGSYTVTVTDNNGCTVPASAVVTITQPVLALSANLSSKTDVFCSGGNTGAATVTATGGSGAYSYSWNTTPDQTSATAVNLSSGSYTVTITDNNGCILPLIIAVTITEPASIINAGITSQTNILCFGDSTGSSTVTASGGSGNFSYSWNTTPVQTTATATNLTAGSYTVSVTDNNGCTIPVTEAVTIIEPTSALSVSISSQTNVLCFEEVTGAATATVTGGSGTYTYLWNTVPAQIGETAINLGAGSYTVTVNDNNGCAVPAIASLTITQPDSVLTVAATSPFFNLSNISCNGGSDGSINLTLSGGTMPYSFSWEGPGTFVSADQNLSGLGAGLYSVNVIDANGCLTRTTITLIEPSLMASTVGSTPADCIKSNGTADLDIIGGTQPYSCIWSCGITQQNLMGVAGGVYTVNVIDANGCLIIDTVEVDEISNLSLSSIVNDVLCYGTSDGSINLNVKGTAPFTYSWSNGSTTEDLTGVSAGEYIVIINDAAGCTILDTISITQSPQIVLNLTSPFYFDNFNVASFQGNNGAIDLSVNGGHPFYTYSWSNNATTEDISNLTEGNYFVTVTDSLGCQISGSIILAAPLPLEMPTGFSPNGDGKNDKFVIRGIEVYPNNHITIFNRWGNIVYQSDGYHNQWDGVNNKGYPLPAGTYFVIVEINNKEIILKGYVDIRRE